MSVHIPIYKRILYDAPDNKDDIQHIQASVQGLEVFNDGQNLEQGVRQTRSAPSQILVASEFQKEPTAAVSRTLCSAPSLSLTRLNVDNQSQRWEERGRHLNQSRTFKRTSNIIAHRQDMGYYMYGSKAPIKNRYDIDEEELIRLRMLAHSRAERSTRSSTRNNSAVQRKFSPGTSPSGQNSSPVPPGSASLDREKMLRAEGRRKELQKKKEEKERRLEEKERFEKEMEEKYKPKKPVQKNMIFITESSGNDRGRTFLTDGDFMDNGEGAVYSFINENQRKAFTSIFNDMDRNKDGQVDMDELKHNLSSIISKKNLEYFLQVFDLNKDHTVDAREFVTICALNDALCGIKTESETASLALDLERLAKHITIYKELFNVVDEDGDGHVQSDEVLLLVMTALEGENAHGNDNMNESRPGQDTRHEGAQNGNEVHGNTQNGSTQEDAQVSTQARYTKDANRRNPIDQDEAKRVLESIEKDENGFFDFVSFLSYTPFFARLLDVILDSPLSISSLEKTRDIVTRKLSKNATHFS